MNVFFFFLVFKIGLKDFIQLGALLVHFLESQKGITINMNNFFFKF